MKKFPQILLFLIIILFGCKSNQEAYNTTYRKLKEKEEAMLDANAKIAMNVPKNAVLRDSSNNYMTEKFNLILGKEQDILAYNIVSRSFINRTNARGFYSQMLDKGYPAVLVQNEEMMFRIIIGSFSTKEEAESELSELKESFPEAFILFRAK
jgi:cell division septation protein DedD